MSAPTTPWPGHDFGFLIWAVPGALIAFGAIAALTIGAPFLLLGAGLLIFLRFRGPPWPADLGLIAGAGLAVLLVAALHALGNEALGLWPWIGLALVALGAGPYWWLRCRPGLPGPG